MSGANPADADFNNRAVVPGWADYLARWEADSAAVYREREVLRDIAYGPRPRNRLDLFRAATPGRPTVTYIHGGYWQWNDKEHQAFTALGPLGLDLNVAVIEHSLAPEVPMAAIVAEARAAMRFIAANLADWGCAPRGLIAAGTSSGAHLAACCMDIEGVDAGLLVSGCYDLAPFLPTSYNAAMGLDAETARALSPVTRPVARRQVVLAGARELPAIREQGACYAAAIPAGLGRFAEIAGHDHFSVVDDYARPDGAVMAHLAALVEVLAR